jgi:hypothetical protein
VLNLEQHISELLYLHDCVIVPSLGGFLASNQTSSVSAVSQSIYPPYRKLAFNIYLRQNDGLLANHLVAFENMSYEEAIKEIDLFVSGCFDLLDNGKKVVLHSIGSLYYDSEKNIQFEANRSVNYLIDSFGLQPVHFSPVQKISEPAKPATIDRPSVVPVKKLRKNAKRVRNVLGVTGIAAAIAWFSFNMYMVAPKKYQSTSLSAYDSQSFIPKKDTVQTVRSATPVPVKVETVYVASVAPDLKEIPSEATIQKVEEAPAVSETSNTDLHHHVVAGVFKIRENAESHLMDLQRRGFVNAEIIEANGRNYVTFSSFSSYGDAITMADSLRSDSAWIWRN